MGTGNADMAYKPPNATDRDAVAKRVFESLVLKATGYERGDKWYPPDTAAANLILKNCTDWWAQDPRELDIRRRNQELKEKKAEGEVW